MAIAASAAMFSTLSRIRLLGLEICLTKTLFTSELFFAKTRKSTHMVTKTITLTSTTCKPKNGLKSEMVIKFNNLTLIYNNFKTFSSVGPHPLHFCPSFRRQDQSCLKCVFKHLGLRTWVA